MKKHPDKSQRGLALIMALLLVLLLSTIAASLIAVTNTEVWSTVNYRTMSQARFAAEAGAQKAINYFAYTYTGPTSAQLASYNLTSRPVKDTTSGNPIVLGTGISTLTQNYPDSTAATNFNNALTNQTLAGVTNATYSAAAMLMEMKPITALGSSTTGYLAKWVITSQGNISGVRNAQVQVIATIERTSSPLFTYTAFATSATCAALSFGGGGGTDSFDSTNGAYNLSTNESPSGGNIGTNGNISLSGGGGTAPLIKVIDGTLNTPKTGVGSCVTGSPNAETVGSGWTTGALNQLSSPVTYPAPAAPSPLPSTGVQNIRNDCATITGCSCYPGGGYACTNNGPYQLTPGSYADLSLGGGKVVHVTVGTYIINSFSLNGSIIVDSGPVIFNLAAQGFANGTCCALDFSGGSIANPTNSPANFQIIYAGQALIKLTGGSGAYGVIYAPNSAVSIGGGGDWYGSIIGSTVNNGGGTSMHYDRALSNNGLSQLSSFYPVSFTWSKY